VRCRSRTLTAASLAGRRSNALKSAGPRTNQGKARVALNHIKHGRYAVNLPARLARAGYRPREAGWRQIRARIAGTFQRTLAVPGPEGTRPEPQERSNLDRHWGSTVSGPSFEKKMNWLANHRVVRASYRAALPWTKAEDSFEIRYIQSETHEPIANCGPAADSDPQSRGRFGLVFYTKLRETAPLALVNFGLRF